MTDTEIEVCKTKLNAYEEGLVNAYIADPGYMEPWEALLLAEQRDEEANEAALASLNW